MNKLFKKAAAFIAGAVIVMSSVNTMPVLTETQVYAAPSASAGAPKVQGHSVTSEGNALTNIYANTEFALEIRIKDEQKTTGSVDKNDIIFTKPSSGFNCENASVEITSANGAALEYTVSVGKCTWLGGSNKFNFKVGYTGNDPTDLSLTVTQCSANTVDPDQPSSSYAEPIFMFTAQSTTTIEAGETGLFTLEIKNLGLLDVKRVLIEVTAPDDIVLTNNSGTRDISAIWGGGSTSIVIRYKALDRITSTKQSFGISMRYYYDTGSGETIGSANSTVNLAAKISNDGSTSAEPIFKITPSNIAEIKSGESGYFNVELKNLGNLEAKRVLVETTASDDIILTDGSGSQDISSISAGDTATVKISYKALGKVSSAKQAFGISLRYYYDGASGEAIGTATATVNVPADTADLAEVSAPTIKITGQTLALPITAGSEYEYTLTVRNFSDTPAEDVYLFLDASDSLYFIDGTETAEVGSIAAKGSASVRVKFRTVDSMAAVKQGITAHISFAYIDGGVKKTAESDSSVTIIASETNGGSGDGNIAVPNIIIKSYDIGAEQIPAGDPFDLALKLFNTSSLTGVENVIMTINAGGSVNIFGGTNTFYYPTLDADGEISETIPLKALATAETGTSSISVSLKYDYTEGGSRATANLEQTIFIPVYQPDKMTFEVQVPTWSAQVGQDMYITTTYLNKGRSEIANVKAEIVGDVGALSTSKVIGTVQPGGNGSFDFIVNPYMPGTCEFTIKVTYEDATLTEITKEFPVSFEVEDMFDPGIIDPGTFEPGIDDPSMNEGGNFPWAIVWICAGVIVVGGVVAIILIVKHKKKKKSALTEADIDWEDEFEDKKPETNNTNNNNNDNNTTTV